ncbi:MAG: hypothetical protein KAW45_02180 [Thermoplasmatales archaeon]|nr:hypothetical protein [Thermoplasmatales archaeon]
MAPDELFGGTEWAKHEINSFSGISKRILKSKRLNIQKFLSDSFLNM